MMASNVPKLSGDFVLCSQFASSKAGLPRDLDTNTKLRLYALYKYALHGPCTKDNAAAKKPGMFDFSGKAKYAAWEALGDTMAKGDAEKEYIAVVESVSPEWREKAEEMCKGKADRARKRAIRDAKRDNGDLNNMSSSNAKDENNDGDEDDEDEDEYDYSSDEVDEGDPSMMALRMSRFALEDEEIDGGADAQEEPEAVSLALSGGDDAKLAAVIDADPRVLVESKGILPPLLAAIDRGHLSSVLVILDALKRHKNVIPIVLAPGDDNGDIDNGKANSDDSISDSGSKNEISAILNAIKDEDGVGALHYAAWCESVDIYMALLKEGADETAKDDEGLTPLEVMESSFRNEVEIAKSK